MEEQETLESRREAMKGRMYLHSFLIDKTIPLIDNFISQGLS